ncbi:inactive protein restricted tev movement 1 [Nicotiana attenuata]|uniref:Inactive protein restricted tev movement 1 n=2 Tax=Nicotiana attenuata TaxID=49451 RepID=A0A1J6KUF2_NICAT|nr:inactive protein restricted tev movement 1 [Nicotiana attenuata]
MIKVSPREDPRGTIWDEKGRDQLAGIYVFYDKYTIHGLQFLFYENGSLVMSNIHGVDNRENFHAIVFDYPSEFLTSISCSFCHLPSLESIKFGTNKVSYGPFGTPSTDAKDFNFQIGNHLLFGGFHGTKNCFGIGSIGVYLKNIPSSMTNVKNLPVNLEKEED